MAGQNKTSINWALILPLGLLLLEAVAVMVMITSGYEISQVLLFFLIFLAIFLVYQIFRQLSTQWRVKHATSQLTQAQALINTDQPLAAITLLKEALFSLAESDYLAALYLMNHTYAKENKDDAVAQVNAIHAESLRLFEMRQQPQRFTDQDKHNWRVQADKLRNMIQGLPEQKEQSLSEARMDK